MMTRSKSLVSTNGCNDCENDPNNIVDNPRDSSLAVSTWTISGVGSIVQMRRRRSRRHWSKRKRSRRSRSGCRVQTVKRRGWRRTGQRGDSSEHRIIATRSGTNTMTTTSPRTLKTTKPPMCRVVGKDVGGGVVAGGVGLRAKMMTKTLP